MRGSCKAGTTIARDPLLAKTWLQKNDETGWGQRTPALGRNGDEDATANTGSVEKGDTQQKEVVGKAGEEGR